MSVPVIIIIGGPRPAGRTALNESVKNEHQFDNAAQAIEFLQSLPDQGDDGTSES